MADTYFKVIPNKFGKRCSGCNNWVPDGAGKAIAREKPPAGQKPKWETLCISCFEGNAPAPAVVAPVATFPLTDEQEQAVALFKEGQSIAIQAGAGTGKTSTLVAIARSTTRQGQYVAFNKDVVRDAVVKFAGTNCDASTAHSLAFRQVGKDFSHRLKSTRQSSLEIAQRLGLEPFSYVAPDGEIRFLDVKRLAGLVYKGITQFCNSASSRPTPKHLPYVDGIDAPDDDGHRTYENNRRLQEHLKKALVDAWDDLTEPDGQLRFSHDHYVKIWELGLFGAPVIPGDYILFDEAQDANPVLLSVVEQQKKQVVFVGDSQQAIYEWRGAVDALDQVPAETTTFLTNSFRFGPEVAEVANTVLNQIDGAELRIVGRGKAGRIAASVSDEPVEADAILTRSNAGAIAVVLDNLDRDKSVHLVGGGGEVEAFAKAAQQLQRGQRTEHPELSLFTSWAEVNDYVENDPNGGDLQLLVRLINKHGVAQVLRAVQITVSEADADIVVSTAHKSKGREWDHVAIHSDFPPVNEDSGPAEWRLLYVAVTRARIELDVTSCEPIARLVGGA